MFGLFKSKKSQSQLAHQIDYDNLPVMTAEELINFTQQQNRVRSIKRIIQIDDRHWQAMYLEAIYKFAELVQLMPASQAHHHSVPGGLLIHTLEVIERAVNLRQQYKLPAFAPIEIQDKEKHVWTYAVFLSAMLHDVGKRTTLCSFMIEDGKFYNAFDQPISSSKYKHYKIVFLDPKYNVLHEKIGLTFFGKIVPQIGQSFIFSYLDIVREMMSYIHGEAEQDNVILKIIKQADMQSTGASLMHSPSHKFKGANLENIGQRLMTQLRQLIASNNFIINKSNANIFTTKEGFTYCVSKVIVDGIREAMKENNELDVPKDNNRVFDILQEHGLAETNPKNNKVIHIICIYHNETIRKFTVLKFKTEKLFSIAPDFFPGHIEETENKEAIIQAPPTIVAENDLPTQEPSKNIIKEGPSEEDFPFPESGQEEEKHEPIYTTARGENPKPPSFTPSLKKQENNEKLQLAYDFLAWCRKKIIDKGIVINESNGLIQKVSYKNESYIAVVTPKIFVEFGKSINMSSPEENYKKIQSAIHKAKLNHPCYKGQIHTYKIKKSNHNPMGGNIKIRHYLFEVSKFCGNNNDVMYIIKSVEDNTNLVHT